MNPRCILSVQVYGQTEDALRNEIMHQVGVAAQTFMGNYSPGWKLTITVQQLSSLFEVYAEVEPT